MIAFIATHQPLFRALAVVAAVVAVVGALLLLARATRREPATGRHSRAHGVYHGKTSEVRRHRRNGREHTWPGTSTTCARTTNTHVLDETAKQRCRTANRIEATVEITQAERAAVLGAQPALTGAAA